MLSIRPELIGAAKIFVTELSTHLGRIQKIADEAKTFSGEDLRKYLASKATKLEHRFHVMKGGAGFLQLEEISTTFNAGRRAL